MMLNKGAERLAELAEKGILADEAATTLLKEGLIVSAETLNHLGQ